MWRAASYFRSRTKKHKKIMSIVKLNICLSDVPKEAIYAAKNGKKYLTCEIHSLRQTDQYGNTHSLSVSMKEGNGYKPYYIGKGKEVVFGADNRPQPQANPTPAPAPSRRPKAQPEPQVEEENEGEDDLPF